MNLQELKQLLKSGEITEHHTSMTRGYVSRKNGETEPAIYNGKFGKGYTTFSPNFDSTRYCFVTYYIQS